MFHRLLMFLRAKKNYIFLPVLFSFFLQSGSAQEAANNADALASGKTVEREISAKEIHRYKIALAENQSASIVVEQRGIDVAVRIINPISKKAIFGRDSNLKTEGFETLDFAAVAAGEYVLEIEGKTMSSPTGRYAVTLAEVRAATESERRLEEARTLHNEGIRLWNEGKFTEALPVAERALAIREKESGADDIDVAASLASLALIVADLGDYDRAIAAYKRAFEIREKAFGTYHQDVARTLHNWAIVYDRIDNYEESARLYQKAVEIREKVLGLDNAELATSYSNLGLDYKSLGDYDKAESYIRRGLEIKQKAVPPNNSSIAFSLVNLGSVYSARGDQDRALELYAQAIDLWEKSLGAEHPNIAYALLQTGTIHLNRNEFAQAEKDYLRELNILQKVLGKDNLRLAGALGSLAVLYERQGDYAKAEPLFHQTVEMMERTVGREHEDYAAAIFNLAQFDTDRGDYEAAEPLYRQAAAVIEKIFGSQHPLLITYLSGLARNYEAKGDAAQAVAFLERAHRLSEQSAQIILAANSERQKLVYLDSLSAETDQYISAHQQFAPQNRAALETALTTVLERKGRAADATAQEFAALRSRSSADDQKLFDELKTVTSELARKILNASSDTASDKYQKQVKDLEERKEKLEIEISRRSAEFRAASQPVTLAAVEAAIPENAALIEFCIYRPFDAKKSSAGDAAYGEPRVVAYVVRKNSAVQWKDLGAAKAVNDVIEPFRQALRDSQRKDVAEFARRADALIMQPVRSLTGDAAQLLISPDGELNLIPFEALMDERGKYLVENYSFSYLTSGRDLLRMQTARASKSDSLIVADPTFGASPAEQTADTRTKGKSNAAGKRRRSVTAARNMSETYFAPLGGTLQEARSIRKLFPDAQFLTGSEATETALKQANAPEILHIATHGFFLEDERAATQNPATRDAKTKIEIENPLLRSGLALAGANRRATGAGDDGILTAFEASGLSLWGTKLVVLSACDTGLGEIKNGEGVYGLRRAFALAGTESLVMSLWSVSDFVTRELMIDYYKNLKNGIGRGASLRNVQLEMIKRKGREHPFYWAAFIQSGEWANLDGKR